MAGAVSAQLTNELSLLWDQSWEWLHGWCWAQPRGQERPGPAVAAAILDRAAVAASAGLEMNLACLILLAAMQSTAAHKQQQQLALFFSTPQVGKAQGRCQHPVMLCAGPEGTA